jgi:phosphatidylinositol-3,4,5-trisphosphate 3-phosphatase/dual-specificity protein phosphatase PTEN
MFAKAKAAAAKAAADAQSAIDEADRKYGISDAVADASAKASAKLDEVDEKYAISESVGAAVDTVNQKVEATYGDLDQKYALGEKAAKAGAAIDEFTDEAAAKAYRVAGDVKVGLAIGHVDIDPWAGGPSGDFLVRPVLAQEDGTFAYLSDRAPRFPDAFSAPDATPLRMHVDSSGITITSDAGDHIEYAPRALALETMECWQVFPQDEGVPGIGGLVGLRLFDRQGARYQLAYELVDGSSGGGKQTAAGVCSLLDSLTFRYSVHKPHVVPSIFVSFGATAVLVANPLCGSAAPPAGAVASASAGAEQVSAEAPSPEPEPQPDAAAAAAADDDYEERLAYTFTLMDKHGSGHVSYIQFLSWWKARSAEAGEGKVSDETLKSSQVAFRDYDTNENGTIELEELDALLRALDLVRFVPESLPEVEDLAGDADPATTDADHVSQDVWLARFDFREHLVAALTLSPDGRSWPDTVPRWTFVHRRGMLEQGQDRSSIAVHDFEVEETETDAAAGAAAAGGVTVDGVLEGMDSLATRAANPLRTLVTGDKARYTEDGYDLNLTYIEERLIAMGMPAENTLHKMTRNPAAEVSQFLETKHAGKYRIYNLCIEQYACYSSGDERFSSGSVLHYPCVDHNPGRLSMMHHFALSVHAWLQADPENVAAVHCKAGKGRTGTFICAALMVMHGMSAEAALEMFESQRTAEAAKEEGKVEGVRAASQLQYVLAYSELLRAGPEQLNQALLAPPTRELYAVQLQHGPTTRGLATGEVAKDMWLTVLLDQSAVIDQPGSGVAFCGSTAMRDPAETESNIHFDCLVQKAKPAAESVAALPSVTPGGDVVLGLDGTVAYGPTEPTPVCGDIRLQFFMHKGQRGEGDGGRLPAPELVAYCWLHTACITPDAQGLVTLPLDSIDVVKPWSKEALEAAGLSGMTVSLSFEREGLRESASGPVLSNPLAMQGDDDDDDDDGGQQQQQQGVKHDF